MRFLAAIVVLFGLVSGARAGDALQPYSGKVVISPDTPPTVASELPAYLAANVDKTGSYVLAKGSPWSLHLVGVLPKPQTKPVTLVFADKDDKKLAPLISLPVTSKGRFVIAHTELTFAAGFAANKTYLVRLMLGTTVLAKSELTLRD